MKVNKIKQTKKDKAGDLVTYENVKGLAGEITPTMNSSLNEWNKLNFGMFIHLGLYSVLGGEWKGEPVTKGYSEQIQMWANIPDQEYEQVAHQFSLDEFNPQAICTLAKNAGMKYIVITTKHHDGFCLFDTETTDYNLVKATPFKKDLVKLLAEECAKQGLGFGVYYSLVDWHLGHGFDHDNNNPIPTSMEPIIETQLTELMTNYGPIVEVWFDMSSPTEKQSQKFAEIVKKHQPHASINSRIWNNQGDFRTLNDNQIPSKRLDGAWQTPASIYHATWSYRRWQERDDFQGKVLELLKSLIAIRARGGNYLLNIGPHGDGSVVPFEQNVLETMGEWLTRHPNAVLGTKPTKLGEQPWGEVTSDGTDLYLHIFAWPKNNKLSLEGLVTKVNHVAEDYSHKSLAWEKQGNTIEITLPDTPADEWLTTVKVELDGELHIIPDKVISVRRDSVSHIEPEELEFGYKFADEGNYTSLTETNVRQTAYLLPEKDEGISLKFKGKANENFNYKVSLGAGSVVVSGKELLNSTIAPLKSDSENEILQLDITLFEPEHAYQDLELEIQTVEVCFKN